MEGDNVGRVVRWDAHSDCVEVRLLVDTVHGVPVTSCTVQVEASIVEEAYQVMLNRREIEAQAALW